MATVAEMEVESTAGTEKSSYEKADLQAEENVNGRVNMMSELQNSRFQNNLSNISSLERAEILFKKGLDAVQSHKYEDGVEFLDSALRIRVRHYGEYAPECGTTYLEYGRALYFNATEYSISQMYDDSESFDDESEEGDEPSISSDSSFADTETSSGTPAPRTRIKSFKEILFNGDFRDELISSIPPSADERKGISNMEEKQTEGSVTPATDDASSDNEGFHCSLCQSAMEDEDVGFGCPLCQSAMEDEDVGFHCPHCQSSMEYEDDDLYYAWETLKIARTIFKKDEKANELNIADASRTLGDVYVKKRDLNRALKEYTKALTIFEGTLNPDSPHIASLLYDMCFALASQERVGEALNYGRRSVKVFECWLYRVQKEVQRTEGELPIRASDSVPARPKYLALTAHEQDLKDGKGEFDQKLIKLKQKVMMHLGRRHHSWYPFISMSNVSILLGELAL